MKASFFLIVNEANIMCSWPNQTKYFINPYCLAFKSLRSCWWLGLISF